MMYLTSNAVFANCTFVMTVQMPTRLPIIKPCVGLSPNKPFLVQPGPKKAALGAGNWSIVGMIVKNAMLLFAMIVRNEMMLMNIEHLPQSKYRFTL